MQNKKWSIENGDYKRRSDDHYLNMDEIRKREKIKKVIFLTVLLVIAFSAEFFVLRQIAKM